ncbi:MAG: carboxypeptidase-like regulatory domain-containing protein [Acidobacteriaceae bacterium]
MKLAPALFGILLVFVSCVCALPQQRPNGGAISGAFHVSGTVVDEQTHRPVANAKVALLISQAGEEQRRVANTGGSGIFVFNGVSAGKYDLYAEARGYAQQALNAHDNFLTGVAAGPGKNSENIVFALSPEAIITGAVGDEAGEPVRDAHVALFRKTNTQGIDAVSMVGMQNTDDRGSFEFRKLRAGAYYIAVGARPWYASMRYQSWGLRSQQNRDPALDVVYPVTFFGGSTDEANAQSIHLKVGQKFEADVALYPTPGLHVRVRGTAGRNSPTVTLQRKIFGSWQMPMGLQMNHVGEGDWEMSGVAPGRYIARVQPVNLGVSMDPGTYRSEQVRQFPVEITGDTEIDPAQGPGVAQVTGVVQLPVSGGKTGNRTLIFRNTLDRQPVFVPLQKDGSFKNTEITVGRYQMELTGPGGYAVQSLAASGAATVVGHQIEFSSGAAAIAIIASNDHGEIHGVVLDHGKPLSGAMVLLVPREGIQEKERIQRDESDSDGTFSLRTIPAGNYTLLALRDGWTMEWGKPEVLAPYLRKGIIVRVGGRETGEVKLEAQ